MSVIARDPRAIVVMNGVRGPRGPAGTTTWSGIADKPSLLIQLAALSTSGNEGKVLKVVGGVLAFVDDLTGGGSPSDTTAPTITSSNTLSVAENNAFSHTLTANETVTWSKVGGADAALFTLAGSNLTMTAKDFETPADADGNNSYVVQVRATDVAGNYANQTISVTVSDQADGPALAGLLIEGDSITSNSPGVANGSYAWLYKDAHPSEIINVRAQGSRALGNSGNLDDGGNTLYGHRTEDLGYNAKIWSVFIGANDLGGTTYASGQAYFDALVAYIAPIRVAGVKVALASILPFDSRHPQAATHNSKRAAFNTILLNNLSQVADYLIPFGSIPEFNTGADPLPVLSDGVHLSPTGINLTAEVYAAVMDAIRTNATATAPSGAAWFGANVTGAAQGAIVERRYVVKGLAPGSTASFTVSGTGGRIKVGAGAYGTSALIVRNGDVAMLEVTASGSLSTARTVNVTMGGTTQAVTVTTAATAPATTTFDPTRKNNGITLLNDNREMNGSGMGGGYGVASTTTAKAAGKWAIEFEVLAISPTPAVGFVADGYNHAQNARPGRENDSGVIFDGDSVWDATPGSGSTYLGGEFMTVGAKITLFADMDNDRCWMARNGSIMGGGDPAAGTGGYLLPADVAIRAYGLSREASSGLRVNAGQEAMALTIPGFAVWG